MDTNVIIAIVVAVVVIAAIIIGAWWFGKASKRSVERATDEAVAKGVQLATEDTEHAGNADADHTQHAEVSAASAEVAGTAAVKAQKPSVSAVASAAEEPPVAKTVVETPEGAPVQVRQSVRQGPVQHPRQGSALRSRLGGRRRHPSACRCWRGSQRTACRGTTQRRPNRGPVRPGRSACRAERQAAEARRH